MSLDELESSTEESAKPLGLEQLSDNLVFGEGNPEADLVIIGEGPGEDEDLSGRPFVGRAGQLLDKILESVHIKRDDIYITNIVKYRPPGNRNPSVQEIQASEPLLLEQLRLINPQIIATLGNVPTQFFVETTDGITRTHGSWYDWNGVQIFPLYHPAYLLRNPSRDKGGPKWQMWEDMKLLKKAVDALGVKEGKLIIDSAKQEGLF